MSKILFHCNEKSNFPDGNKVRAFIYTNYSIEMHNHDFYEINIILSGSGTHCIENGKIEVKVGDVYVIPPMVAHAYIDTENLDVYHILLQKEFINENKTESETVNGFLQFIEIEPFLRGNFPNAFFLHLNPKQLIQIKNEFEFIDDNGYYSLEEFSAMRYHSTWKLIYLFSLLLNKQLKTANTNIKNIYEIQIINTLEYIHKHYGDKITINDLCSYTYLSRSTFLRSFKSVCGIPPMEYLKNYRCKKALELLENSEYSKTNVAYECGFYDLSHLERILKQYCSSNSTNPLYKETERGH